MDKKDVTCTSTPFVITLLHKIMVQVVMIMMVEIDISGGVGVGVVSARAVPRFGRTRKMTIKKKDVTGS